jgi:phosphoribosylformimino-5-aminoimidazole carboxamide ribotide isomerase
MSLFSVESLILLSSYCDEFLVHGVDVEGKRAGIETDLVALLGDFASTSKVPVTYAGGVRSMEDLQLVRSVGRDFVDCTVGSALDCFGGDLSYDKVVEWHRSMNPI